jgi:hypothetical protein
MPSHEHVTPSFMPTSCAEVVFAAASGEERCGATWFGIVLGDKPRLYTSLVGMLDEQHRPMARTFTVRLSATDLPESLNCHPFSPTAATVHIQCRAGTEQREHERLLFCGEVATVEVEETAAPWLAPLLRASARTHPQSPPRLTPR